MSEKTYNFGEKKQEFNAKKGEMVDVVVNAKYHKSRKKAIELIEKYDFLDESDFWILMNETKSGKMAYTGLIISHNACLRLNDSQPPELKFQVESLSSRISEYSNGLLYEYANSEQGLYEVGEVTSMNCKNAYPHAMAFKRLFDRVVLKLTKIAYDGILSDSEGDELKEPEYSKKEKVEKKDGYVCELCGTVTYGTKTRPASELKEASIKKYGQPLCKGCAEKASKVMGEESE